jgi:hypothetical protein
MQDLVLNEEKANTVAQQFLRLPAQDDTTQKGALQATFSIPPNSATLDFCWRLHAPAHRIEEYGPHFAQ